MGPRKYDKPVAFHLPERAVTKLEELVQEGAFRSLGEAARSLIAQGATNLEASFSSNSLKRSDHKSEGRKRKRSIAYSFRVNDTLLELLDKLVEEGYFLSKSEAVRYFILQGATELLKEIRAAKESSGEEDVQ
jgi:Arc/MetJ-type ribon-helix-helix transcriptional regulator